MFLRACAWGKTVVSYKEKAMRTIRKGFTLVELLVVIGIIAILMSILLPSLSRARATANTIKCAANLRAVGQGLMIYINENKGIIPAAYNYRDCVTKFDTTTGKFIQQSLIGGAAVTKAYGYIHWSSYVNGTVPAEAFQCPALPNGGIPATFAAAKDKISGQLPDGTIAAYAGTGDALAQALTGVEYNTQGSFYVDAQAPRMAYSVNEALFARPKYGYAPGGAAGFDGALHFSRNVNIAEVKNPAGVIMASEFPSNAKIIEGKATAGGSVYKSHRPTTPFVVSGNPSDLDKNVLSSADIGCATSTALRRANVADLWTVNGGYTTDLNAAADLDPTGATAGSYAITGANRVSRLDWVGRNHPGEGQFARDNNTNFLYADGHVETKSVLKTIPQALNDAGPWEWGDKMYSIPDTTVQAIGSEVK